MRIGEEKTRKVLCILTASIFSMSNTAILSASLKSKQCCERDGCFIQNKRQSSNESPLTHSSLLRYLLCGVLVHMVFSPRGDARRTCAFSSVVPCSREKKVRTILFSKGLLCICLPLARVIRSGLFGGSVRSHLWHNNGRFVDWFGKRLISMPPLAGRLHTGESFAEGVQK